jgi:hypothetical protein
MPRNEGLRTANLALPFKVLRDFSEGEIAMASLTGETSNQLFQTLEDWQAELEHKNLSTGK